MSRVLRTVLAISIISVCVLAADGPKKLREESMQLDRFAEVHAPLLRSPASKDAATLTERVATSLSGQAKAASVGRMPRRNFIDEQIFGKMERERIPHAPLASDYEFLRRVTLDLTGRIPSSEDVRSSSADTDPAKRDKVIDRLLAS